MITDVSAAACKKIWLKLTLASVLEYQIFVAKDVIIV